LADSTSTSRSRVLYDIVFCLVRLDLCTLETATAATDRRDQSLFGWDDHDHIKNLLSEGPLNNLHFGLYDGHEPQELRVRQFIEALTTDQVIYCIRDSKTLPYFSRLFEQKLTICQMALARKQVVDASHDFTVPGDMIEAFGEGFSKSEYADYCVRECRGARIALRFVYNVALQLRDYIPKAVSQGLLDETSLERLKPKMSAMQEHFHETCNELGKPTQDLLWEKKSWW
jgi:hypothetical protein